MGFGNLFSLALLCLVIVGIQASPAEDYWQSVWPNTPIPNALWDILQPSSEGRLPIGQTENKQYWTVFLENDLHPGKKMSLGIHMQSDHVQPFGTRFWKVSDKTKTNPETQPFGARFWKANDEINKNTETQPFGARFWKANDENEKNPEIQPFGARFWKTNDEINKNPETQPFGARFWKANDEKEENPKTQPFGARFWKANDEINKNSETQPFGTRFWKANDEKEKNPETQPLDSTSRLSKGKTIESERDILKDYCENTAAIGEDKYCATSLESMMDFAISKLGKDIKVISSSFAPDQDQYVVEEVRKIGESLVMCHRMNLEKVVFYCHQVNATTSYMVPLVAPDGNIKPPAVRSMALTVCHHDTRGVDPHLLYQMLKVKPGTVPICHFVGNKAVAWIPNSSPSENNHACIM